MIKRLFGQYVSGNSAVHRLDPRIKISSVFILSIMLFWAKSPGSIAIITAAVILVILISRLQFGYIIKSLKPFIAITVFVVLMYLIFSRNRLNEGYVSVWRFLIMIILSIILTSTTTIRQLIGAIEFFLRPLILFKIKTRNIALLLSITIRFVPSFFAYAERVKEAFIARGSSFKRARSINLLILKLLDRMLRSASTLSDAIESRCYDWGFKK